MCLIKFTSMILVLMLSLVLLSNATNDDVKEHDFHSQENETHEDDAITDTETRMGMERESSNEESKVSTETVYETNYYSEEENNLSAPQDYVELSHSLTVCSTDKDCADFTDDNTTSTCNGSACTCQNLNKKNATIVCTVKSSQKGNLIGSKCPCAIKTAECMDNICVCKSDYKKTEDRRNCVKISLNLHENCVDNQQCLTTDIFSQCSDGVCVCQDNHFEYKGMCQGVSDAKINCTNDDECGDNSNCMDKKCVCDENSVPNNDKKCVKKSKYEMDCENDYQCKQELGVGGECNGNVCKCSAMYYNVTVDGMNNQTKCEKYTNYGDTCKTDADCQNKNMMNGSQAYVCMDFECVCADGYSMQKDADNNRLCSDKSQSSLLVIPSIYIILFAQYFIFKF